MSLYKCDGCSHMVDTDISPDGWVETKYGDVYYCGKCRKKIDGENDLASMMESLYFAEE